MDTFLSNIAEYASSPQKLRYVSSSWNEALLGEEQLIMESLHRKYPGVRCLYDIMILIAHNNDIDTLKSILISYRGYLPINWNRYSYHVKSVEMLRLILPYLTDDHTRVTVKNRIYILTHNTDDISKLELRKYLYAILLDKRYDILTDPKYSAQDWIPYLGYHRYSLPKESIEWLVERGILPFNMTVPLYEQINRDNMNKILNSFEYSKPNVYNEMRMIDRLMDLLKEYPTDKDVVYPILGISIKNGYVEILDCYLTKANYIPSLALSNYPDDDTGIFLLRNGFSSSTDFLRDLPMSILPKLLATIIAKDNLSLYIWILPRNKANVSILRDKINKYIDKYPENREKYRL